jgi:hypothetical protein
VYNRANSDRQTEIPAEGIVAKVSLQEAGSVALEPDLREEKR